MFRSRWMLLALLTIALAAAPVARTLAATTPPAHSGSSKSHSTKKAPEKVDLNAASREELMTHLGVDGPTADKIVAARPFKSKSELKSRHLVTDSEYGKVEGKVFVKTSSATPAPMPTTK